MITPGQVEHAKNLIAKYEEQEQERRNKLANVPYPIGTRVFIAVNSEIKTGIIEGYKLKDAFNSASGRYEEMPMQKLNVKNQRSEYSGQKKE